MIINTFVHLNKYILQNSTTNICASDWLHAMRTGLMCYSLHSWIYGSTRNSKWWACISYIDEIIWNIKKTVCHCKGVCKTRMLNWKIQLLKTCCRRGNLNYVIPFTLHCCKTLGMTVCQLHPLCGCGILFILSCAQLENAPISDQLRQMRLSVYYFTPTLVNIFCIIVMSK